jgi:serine/threonine-protein kinase
VKTPCLRTGERCISHFLDPKDGSSKTLVFANGEWKRTSEYAATVCTTDGNRIVTTGEFPLPQPAEDPITLLTGHAHQDSTSPACKDWDYDERFVRTGD